MKKRGLLAGLFILFFAEAALLFMAAFQKMDFLQDSVAVNEVLQSVQAGWEKAESGEMEEGQGCVYGENGQAAALDYVVLGLSGKVLWRTKPGLSESINEAVLHRDTILDVEVDGVKSGKLIIYNGSGETFRAGRRNLIVLLAAAMVLQWSIFAGYFFYLEHTVVKPFQKLKGFAERIAGGNLDIPLKMDRKNRFGAFTEAFDLMRSELKRARLAEAKANAEKRELVAKLSHDIKTPVASIKAAAEVGAAVAACSLFGEGAVSGGEPAFDGGGGACSAVGSSHERLWKNYEQIIRKADQIDTLITGLFTAALEELRELPVSPAEFASSELSVILENADYLHRAEIPEIPDCLLLADKLRLQQVFDNLFANSYKYAGTDIEVTANVAAGQESRFLVVSVMDLGGGVGEEELPFLKEKFKRGKNAGEVPGAGLGLSISDYFMRKMGGELILENGEKGLKASVRISLGT